MPPDSPENPDTPSHGEASQVRVQALQLRALKVGLLLRAPPPLPASCCGRGCNGCVWDGYFSALHYWCEEAAHAMLPIS